jgi:hypothetical protein
LARRSGAPACAATGVALVAFEPQQLVERWCVRIRQPGRQGITRVPGSKLGQVPQLLDDLRPRSADPSESDLGFGDDERLLSLERVGAAANAGGDAPHFSRYASAAGGRRRRDRAAGRCVAPAFFQSWCAGLCSAARCVDWRRFWLQMSCGLTTCDRRIMQPEPARWPCRR